MALAQPTATDKRNSPSHSLLHRIVAVDTSAPAMSLCVDSSGHIVVPADKRIYLDGASGAGSDTYIYWDSSNAKIGFVVDGTEEAHIDANGMTINNDQIIIDANDVEALLIRKNSDGGDVFAVDTTNSIITSDGKMIIDITDTEALLVRKNADAGDVFTVDTTNSRVSIAELLLTTVLAVQYGGTGKASWTANQLVYASGATTLAQITAVNSAVLVTNGSGVPSLSTDIPTAVTIGSAYIYRVGGTDVAVGDGGTGLSSWTANGIVYASGTTTLAQITGANDSVLVTNGSGVPSLSTDLPAAVTLGGVAIVTTTGSQTLTNKTLTAPRFADLGFLADSNGNELIVLDLNASAVNEILVANAATGNAPRIAAQGGDTNVNLELDAKGSGIIKFNQASVPTVTSLSDGANIATDASLGNHFRVTLGGNRTLDNPTNPTDGQRAVWEFIQDATGSRTISLGAAFAFGTDITGVTLSTTASKRDFMGAIYNSTASKWYVVAFVKGY